MTSASIILMIQGIILIIASRHDKHRRKHEQIKTPLWNDELRHRTQREIDGR